MDNAANFKRLFSESTQSPADALAAQSEAIIAELTNMRAGLFTVGELHYLYYWRTKVRFGTSVEQEQKLLNGLLELKSDVLARG